MALEQSRHFCGGVTLIKIALPDRRGRQVPETWLFLRHVELCLYGGSSGAVNKLLGRCAHGLCRSPVVPPTPLAFSSCAKP